MADESPTPAPQTGRNQDGRNAGTRDGGGFRIRLSDNEMRSARSIQEAFRLRSTVAVLGFAVRTVAQLLEEGKLDELVAQQQAQAGPRREGGRSEGGRSEGGRGEARREGREGRGGRQERQAPRVDPFARPARPSAAPEPAVEPTVEPAVEPEAAAAPESEAPSTADAPSIPEAPAGAEPSDTAGDR